MPLAAKIQQYIQKLPEAEQADVLVYVKSLSAKKKKKAISDRVEESWGDFSLSSAMRGMENEDGPEYTTADLKKTFISV
jgi:hypothetical protein